MPLSYQLLRRRHAHHIAGTVAFMYDLARILCWRPMTLYAWWMRHDSFQNQSRVTTAHERGSSTPGEQIGTAVTACWAAVVREKPGAARTLS